jgi:beta-lactamase regulating signal transducer with metallopeptidase domain
MQLLLEALTYHRGADEPLSLMIIPLVRATLVVAVGWLASRALACSSAAVEHRAWLLATVGTLVVPVVWAMTPRWRVPLVTLEVEGAVGSAAVAAAPWTRDSAWPELLAASWIVGTLVALAYLILGIVSAWRLFRLSAPCEDRGWLAALDAARRETGLRRRVELRVAARSISPAVWGFRRVRILLPEAALGWPPELRRSVLLHELAHAARRDCLSQIVAAVACAAWWFHPLVWFAAGRLRALAEQAADDCVLRAGQRRADYAQHLLTIAAALGWHRAAALAQTMFHPSHLEQRLRAILDPGRSRGALGWRPSAASILIGAVAAIPLATFTPSMVRCAAENRAQAVPQAIDVDVHLKLRLINLPPGHALRPLDSDPSKVITPEPPIFQLLPNWEVGRRAEKLIPNYVPGMAQELLVQSAPAARETEALRTARAASEIATSQVADK